MRPSCELRFKDGGVFFEKEDAEHGPSHAERQSILSHFAQPVTILEGGTQNGVLVDNRAVVPPGSLKHFRHAAYQLPPPFGRLPRGR